MSRTPAGPREQLVLGLPPDGGGRVSLIDRHRRGTAFLDLPIRQALNSPAATRMDFWTLNPYVGCELGCSYCYARGTHRYVSERNGVEPGGRTAAEAFERDIFVKRGADRVLLRTLDPGKLAGQPLLIGTATDPYQPAERRFGVTRSVLEALTRFDGLEIWLTTKSPLVARDIDLLRVLARRHRLSVCISLISTNPSLIRRLEPRTPLPHARLRAVEALGSAGIPVGLLIAPIIPGLTDGWGSLGSVMASGREAGARFAVGSALRLTPVARDGFLPILQREFPELLPRYRRRYGEGPSVGSRYLAALDRRIRTLQSIHGFPVQSLRYATQPDG